MKSFLKHLLVGFLIGCVLVLPVEARRRWTPAIAVAGGDVAFLTSNAAGSTRNNFSGYVGFGYTETAARVVTKLGRWVVSGNSGTHTLEMYDMNTSAVVATVSINTSGLSVGYNYVSVTPYTTIIGHVYNVVSNEASGGDSFYDAGSTYTVTSGVTTYGSCVGDNGTYTNNQFSYVPTNFLWH